MQIPNNSADHVTEFRNNVCDFHQKFPELRAAICGCSSSFTQRLATPEERKAKLKAAQARAARVAEARREFPDYYIFE